MTQNNLGNALWRLGGRESGTAQCAKPDPQAGTPPFAPTDNEGSNRTEKSVIAAPASTIFESVLGRDFAAYP